MHAHKPQPKDIAKLVSENLQIPTIPEVASRALRQMSDPNTSGAKLAKTISEDQGLTAKVLKVANSALYALPREVKNLSQAAMLLGMGTLKSIVISASCRSIYKRFGQVERKLWQQSVAAGIAAHHIAQARKIPQVDEAFVAGLMHDVGKVIMNNGDRERFSESIRLMKEGTGCSVAFEQEVFGFSHTDVGSILVRRWELPEATEHAVFLHHDPELAEAVAEDAKELVWCIYLANRVSSLLVPGALEPADEEWDPECDEFAISLGYEEGELTKQIEEIKETFASEGGVLD